MNNGSGDAFLTKFDGNGLKQWTRLLGTSADDEAYDVTTGPDGGIFTVGGTFGALDGQTNMGEKDAYISKFDADGNKLWTRLSGATALSGGADRQNARSVAVAADGKIYFSARTGVAQAPGSPDSSNNNNMNIYVTQFNPYSLSQTSTTSAFNGLTVDLSTQLSTSTALTNIDAALSYFTTASRNVSSGLARANRTRSYLTSSMSLFDARLSRLRG